MPVEKRPVMKRHVYRLIPLLAASVGLFLLSTPGATGAGPALVPPGAPRSEFTDDIEFGKDPFFPASTRRPKTTVKTSDNEPPRPIVPDSVVLKGLTTFQGRRLAIINNYTVGEGEEFTLKPSGLRVKCIEIKEKSVVVSVNGATKEIPLRVPF